MAIGFVLFNNKAGSKEDMANLDKLSSMICDPLKMLDVTAIHDYQQLFDLMGPEDYIILCGGDGTINRFVNDTEGLHIPCDVLYFPNGTGNDFAHELGKEKACQPFSIREYLQDLPSVQVKGKTYRFLNGVGYGIDGYCCEVGDELKKQSDKPVNYTAIAIKGILFHYKPTNAKITVDGKTHEYKKAWLAPTMYGKFFGGGMMPTPEQKRGKDATLSTMVYYGVGKLKALMVFPGIFKGEHVKHKEMVEILTGHQITVEFDRPTALQVDGETILGVTSYTATSAWKERQGK